MSRECKDALFARMRMQLIQKSRLSAGAAATGLGAQADYSQGRVREDCTG